MIWKEAAIYVWFNLKQCEIIWVVFAFFQERGGNQFTHEALSLKYKLDNEFELVFVVSVVTLTRT